MNSTLSMFVQFGKLILSKQNPKLNKHVQKLSHAINISQGLSGFSLLIYKKHCTFSGSYPRFAVARIQHAGEGEGWVTSAGWKERLH